MMRICGVAGTVRRRWTEACQRQAVYLVEVSLGIHYDIRRLREEYDDVPSIIEEQGAVGALRTGLAVMLVHIPRRATHWMGEPDPIPFFRRPGEEEASSGSGKVTSLLPPVNPGTIGVLAAAVWSAVLGWHDPVSGALVCSLPLAAGALWVLCRYANIGWLRLAYLEDREARFPRYLSEDPAVYLAANLAWIEVKARDLVRFARAGMGFQRHLRAAKRQGLILVLPDGDGPDVRTVYTDGCRLRLAPRQAQA